MKALVKTNYARNLWALMREFKVLPTDPRWLELTDEQIEFMLYSMERDVVEADRARRGIQVDGEYEDNDESWWYAEHDEFEALRDDHDEEDIARQVEDLTTEEDRERLRKRFADNEELNEIEDRFNQEAEDVLESNLKAMFAEAKRLESKGIDNWGKESEAPDNQEPQEVSTELTQGVFQDAFAMMDEESGKYEDDYI